MRGYQLTVKKTNPNTLAHGQQFKMLLLSMSVGVLAGVFISCFKLHLGLSGHKALFWMAPVLVARLKGGCKIGTSVGGLFTAMTTYSLGSNLAGGVIGMPLIVAAGALLDVAVNYIEKNKISGLRFWLILCSAGLAANIICLAKRMIIPEGISPHHLFGEAGFWFKLVSYSFFGLLSGFVAATFAKPKPAEKQTEV